MNAHPHSVQLATEPEAPALPDAPRFAQNLMQAAKILVPVFEAGRSIDAQVVPGSGKTPMRRPRSPKSLYSRATAR